MSGHSKWSTIKHKKAAIDAKRGKAFSMISKMVTIAVREGGSGDPGQNSRLRLAVEKAREVNMPKDRIQKAIDKGLGKGSGGQYEELIYEGFGPVGAGILVRVATDNRNRTAAEIKNVFEKNGGALGGPGSVAYLFERVGERYGVRIPLRQIAEKDRNSLQHLVDQLEEIEDVEYVISNVM